MDMIAELKALLTEIGLPQTVVAKRIGYSSSTLNRVLNGTQKPGPELVEKLRGIRSELMLYRKAIGQ